MRRIVFLAACGWSADRQRRLDGACILDKPVEKPPRILPPKLASLSSLLMHLIPKRENHEESTT